MEESLPPKLKEYVEENTRESYTRISLVRFLTRVMSGECISWKDVKNTSLKRHVIKLRRLGLLCIEIADKHCFKICGEG